jgi:dihydroorotase
MNPPLASKEDLQAVIEGLKDGTIDCIATDHAPHSLEEKQKPFAESPFGIVGFETAFGASYKLVLDGHLTLSQLVEKLSTNPAKILGLDGFGRIQIGKKANLTVIMPDCQYTIDKNEFKTKCKSSPFEGMQMQGIAIATVLDGKIIRTN